MSGFIHNVGRYLKYRANGWRKTSRERWLQANCAISLSAEVGRKWSLLVPGNQSLYFHHVTWNSTKWSLACVAAPPPPSPLPPCAATQAKWSLVEVCTLSFACTLLGCIVRHWCENPSPRIPKSGCETSHRMQLLPFWTRQLHSRPPCLLCWKVIARGDPLGWLSFYSKGDLGGQGIAALTLLDQRESILSVSQ